MKRYLLPIVALGLVSCAAFDDAEYSEIIELVAENDVITVPSEGGVAEFTIYSSGNVTLNPLTDFQSFATVDKLSFEKDSKVTVTFDSNEGYRRMVALEAVLDNGARTDTVFAKQEGIQAYINCLSPYGVVDGSKAGNAVFHFESNVDVSALSASVSYVSGGKDWIKEISFSGNDMIVTTNPSTVNSTSKALVKVAYLDGWGEEIMFNLALTASGKNGEFGVTKSFAEVAAMAGTGAVRDDINIKGIVISDCGSRNMGLNPAVNYNETDHTMSDRTAYVQAEDASMGFRLIFDDPDDNVLQPGIELTLSLTNLEVVRDDNGTSCTISGITPENMVRSAVSSVPGKVRKISELKDSDIYTFVEIPNTEFVYKTGAYVNIYEQFALKSSINSSLSGNNNRFDGWAALLVDIDGNAIYAPVNALCLWRRSGNGVPQGVGSVKGILVSEVNRRYGDMGKYQIRVLDESGFCQERQGESAYETYAEWDGSPYHYDFAKYGSFNSRYGDKGSATARLDSIIPSDDIDTGRTPNAELSIENKTVGSSAGGYPISGSYAFCSKICTNAGPGDRGIASFNDEDSYQKSLCLNNEIKGWYKWKDNKIVGYNGLVFRMSTKDIAGSMMYVTYSFDFGKLSPVSSRFAPAHWCVEYSLDGGQTYTVCPDAVTGGEYVHLHAMPWFDGQIEGVKYYSAATCGMGCTDHISFLPSSVFGQEELLVRIRPYDNVLSAFPLSWDGDNENSFIGYNTNANTVINFENINIRYR